MIDWNQLVSRQVVLEAVDPAVVMHGMNYFWRRADRLPGSATPLFVHANGVDAKDCARARPGDAMAPSEALLEMLSAARSSCDALFGRDDAASAAIRGVAPAGLL